MYVPVSALRAKRRVWELNGRAIRGKTRELTPREEGMGLQRFLVGLNSPRVMMILTSIK